MAGRGRAPESVTVAIKIRIGFADGAGPGRPLMTGTAAEIAGDLGRYRAAGAQHLILDFATADPGGMHETLDRFARKERPALP